MFINFYRSLFKSLMLSLAFLLVQSASSFAQQSSLTEPTQTSSQPATSGTRELASLDPLPSAPGAETLPALSPVPAAAAIMIVPAQTQPRIAEPHRFWDRENSLLFAGVAGMATADFFTTHANLANGGRELNPITRVLSGSTPGLATNFALETAGIMGVSYLFHKTGHHRLERMTSVVNISSSAFAVTYGLTHR
jgi:hypothetical protein